MISLHFYNLQLKCFLIPLINTSNFYVLKNFDFKLFDYCRHVIRPAETLYLSVYSYFPIVLPIVQPIEGSAPQVLNASDVKKAWLRFPCDTRTDVTS